MDERPTIVNNYASFAEKRQDYLLGALAILVRTGASGFTVTLNAGHSFVSGQVTTFDNWFELATADLEGPGNLPANLREVLQDLTEDLERDNEEFIHLRDAVVYRDSGRAQQIPGGAWRMPLADVAGWHFGEPTFELDPWRPGSLAGGGCAIRSPSDRAGPQGAARNPT